MKQLIHSCRNSEDGCHHVIVAFYDTVYYYFNNGTNGSIGSNDNMSTRSSAEAELSDSAIIYELVIARKDHNNTTSIEPKTTTLTATTNTTPSSTATTVTTTDPLEVQAVAVVVDENHNTIWCAVARYDKSIMIYSIVLPTNRSNGSSDSSDSITTSNTTLINPQTIYHSNKRVSSMTFATVYGKTIGDPYIIVLVTGDVVGDATAYKLEQESAAASDPVNNTNNATTKIIPTTSKLVPIPVNEHQQEDAIVTKNRRLLLGHTASMLTSVHIVKTTDSSINASVGRVGSSSRSNVENDNEMNQQQRLQLPPQQLILTSDRDEKIRVSRFPDTCIIEGYLLGHTAYITSVDMLPITCTNASSFCVSVGGDCTLRLWDYLSHQELVCISTKHHHHTSNSPNPDSSNHDNDNNNISSKNESETSTTNKEDIVEVVPTKVVVSSDGKLLATIYDDVKYIDFWTIRYSKDIPVGIDRLYTWNSPGQPLGLIFLNPTTFVVIMQEPQYLEQYTIQFTVNNDYEAENKESIQIKAIVATNNAYCQTIKNNITKRDVVMGDGLMEKDEHGCIKMSKMSERRGNDTIKPWNNISRKETNAERIRRLRQRRRNEFIRLREEEEEAKRKSKVITATETEL